MSRCFPFPPSGYARNGSSNDALIFSIKFQEQQKEKSIPDRVTEKKVKSLDKKDKKEKKDRKRDKKEKKDKKRDEKEKLHSATATATATVAATTQNGKQKPDDKLLFKADGLEKGSNDKKRSFEVLERSNLTEEHGRPVDSQNVSCSSDSTGNSSKRKRLSSPASNSIQGNGNIIRIKLSSRKRDEPSTSCILPPRKTEDHSKTQIDLLPSPVSVPVISHTKVNVQEPSPVQVPRPVNQEVKVESVVKREDIPSTSGRLEINEQPTKKLSSHERKMLKKETAYNKLFENLVPPTLNTEQFAVLDDDDDWLFGAKKSRGSDVVQPEACLDNLSCSGSAALQPRAQFLADVGIYALPFTVPF